MKKKETTEEMEKRDAAGYARIPSHASESEEWKDELLLPDKDEGGTEFLASRNESLGFAHRTLLNLEYIEQSRKAGGDHVHVVTQRVVSLLGLIIFPWAEGLEASIKTKRIDMLSQDGWPKWITLQGNTETLGYLVHHLRNAVAHRRLLFSSDSRDPEKVEIEFADAKDDVVYWRTRIGADDLLDFCRRFITLVDDTIG